MFGGKMEKVAKAVESGKEAVLLKLSRDKDKTVRLSAIAGMGKIGRDDSFNLLVPMLSEEDPDVRAAAAAALGVMKNEHASAHLRYRLEREKDPNVLSAIKTAITQLGGGQ